MACQAQPAQNLTINKPRQCGALPQKNEVKMKIIFLPLDIRESLNQLFFAGY
jgi:hypothetical protein